MSRHRHVEKRIVPDEIIPDRLNYFERYIHFPFKKASPARKGMVGRLLEQAGAAPNIY